MKYEDSRQGYINLFAKMTVDPDKRGQAESIVARLLTNRSRYEVTARIIGCPWWFIAAIHNLESNANFATHLHNGDPLTARTVHEPAGRPAVGSPPFTWETSAVDALRLKGLDKITLWELPRCLYEWERYNGWGYIGRENSPYLWSWSSLSDEKGKYVADHVFDANAPTKQCGAAVILRVMMDMKIVEIGKDAMTELRDFLKQFAQLAPTLVTVVAGPVPALAVKALAEAMTNEKSIDTGTGLMPADPQAVVSKLEASPLSTVISIVQIAESIIRTVSAAPVTPVVIAPAEKTTTTEIASPTVVEPNALDRLFPQLIGWKTYIGGAIYILAHIGAVFVPTVITPDILTAAAWLAGGIAGAGLIAKLDRYVSIFKPAVKTTVVVNK